MNFGWRYSFSKRSEEIVTLPVPDVFNLCSVSSRSSSSFILPLTSSWKSREMLSLAAILKSAEYEYDTYELLESE